MARLHRRAFVNERPWSADEFASLLATPGTFALGDSRAFVLARVVLEEAELLTIATDPACRRQGLARGLMTTWQASATNQACTRAILEVAEDNIAARTLYDAFGYTECGRRPKYYAIRDGEFIDALLMDRPLP